MKIENLGNLVANNFIFPLKNGYVLIDTGYENHFSIFCKGLQRRKIALQDITYVFLTHAHDDHAGFLNELLKSTQAKVILSEKAIVGLERGQNSFQGGCSSLLALLFCKMMAWVGKGSHRFPPIENQFTDRYIPINEQTRPWLERELAAKIIETPGHTDCSISLFLDNGVFFCGDAAMNGLPSLHRATIWIENLNNFCLSWEKIIELQPKRIYPGHGNTFSTLDLSKFLPKVRTLKIYSLT